ncbi:MAG: ankyrin repeat domain-containing protein [Caulobacteraceae bacterium]|nr:MAG: ankyrin repeat domain-containing protein [Caulobacteraceae bacterium]
MIRRRLAMLVPALVLVACGQPAPERTREPMTVIEERPAPKTPVIRLEQERRLVVDSRRPDCGLTGDENEAAAVEAAKFEKALVRRLRSGRADPAQEARAAAARKQFGLIWAVPFGDAQPVAVRCNGPRGARLSQADDRPLMRASFYISDVFGEDMTDANLMGTYGKGYNLAMLQHPAFPYADICRVSNDWTRSTQGRGIASPKGWVGPPLPPTSRPRSLGEAARHGTAAALDRWIAREKDQLDQADDFGMTPLAWAVAHDRPVAVRRLLRAGADPHPRDCRMAQAASPLYMALALRRPYAETMAGYGGLGKTRPWPGSLIRLAVETDRIALVRRILDEPWEGFAFGVNPERTHLSADMRAMLEDYQADWAKAQIRREKVARWVQAERDPH